MKKILILGAGIYQVPLIEAAKRIGLYTIVVSIPGNYPGFDVADKVYYVNTTDEEAVLEVARKEKVDAAITAGTDVAVPAMARVCDELGLPGLSYEAAMNSSDKFYMKTQYEKYGVRTAKFRKLEYDDEDYMSKLNGLDYPMIVKAVDSSGSRGITRVNSEEEFPEAIARAKASSRVGYYLVEEYIESDVEFGAQGFVIDGELQFVLPHGDYLLQMDTGVPYGHYAPLDLPEEVLKDLSAKMRLGDVRMGPKLLKGILYDLEMEIPPVPDEGILEELACSVNTERLNNHPVKMNGAEIKQAYRRAMTPLRENEKQACLDIWRYYGRES